MSECTCWCKYPNENHKCKNGHWICIDKYECVRELQKVYNKHGGYHWLKTKCVKKEDSEDKNNC